MDLSAPWNVEARKAAEEDTKKWDPDTTILHEEAREKSIKELRKIWVCWLEERAADVAEDMFEGVKRVSKDFREVAGDLKDAPDDVVDRSKDMEIKLNKELGEKIVEKSTAIDRLDRVIWGILHIHPGWYNQQTTH